MLTPPHTHVPNGTQMDCTNQHVGLQRAAQIDDVLTWLPPSLHTPWRNVFFEYIN